MKKKKIKTTSWDPKFDSEPTSNIPRIVFGHSLVRDLLSNCNHILDVGCGIGSYTQIIDKEGCIGVDLELDALRVAKKYCKNSEFIVSSALNLPFKPEIFDAVFMWEVFDEIPVQSEKPVIREIRRLLLENAFFFYFLP